MGGDRPVSGSEGKEELVPYGYARLRDNSFVQRARASRT